MISVIVPIYNSEKYLHRCIDSILKQNYTDFELLLIDDGSTDNSGFVCDTYAEKDSRVRVFHQSNQGVSAARNLGLDYVQGEFVTFADSDDYVNQSWLSDFAEKAQKADVIFQNAIWHYDDGHTLLRSVTVDEKLSYKEQLALLYPSYFLGYVWAALFKVSIIKEHGIRFNPSYAYKEDENFVLKYCLFASSLFVLPCRNYHYFFPLSEERDYYKASILRVLLEIDEKNLLYTLLGNHLAKEITNDTSIKYELLKLYSSDKQMEEKKKALSYVYDIRPVDWSGRGKLLCMSLFINYLPLAVTHRVLCVLSKI